MITALFFRMMKSPFLSHFHVTYTLSGFTSFGILTTFLIFQNTVYRVLGSLLSCFYLPHRALLTYGGFSHGVKRGEDYLSTRKTVTDNVKVHGRY